MVIFKVRGEGPEVPVVEWFLEKDGGDVLLKASLDGMDNTVARINSETGMGLVGLGPGFREIVPCDDRDHKIRIRP